MDIYNTVTFTLLVIGGGDEQSQISTDNKRDEGAPAQPGNNSIGKQIKMLGGGESMKK